MTIQCPNCETGYTEKTLHIAPSPTTEVRVVCHVCKARLSVRFTAGRNWRLKSVLTPTVTVLAWDMAREPDRGL